MHDCHWDPLAVPGRNPQVLGDVARRIEPAQHGLLLEQRPLAGADVVVIGRRRRRERRVGVAHRVAADLLVVAERRAVGGLVGRQVEVVAALPATDAHLAQPAGALFNREELAENAEAVQEGIVAVRNESAPLRPILHCSQRRCHDPEIGRVPVAAQDPAPVEVLGLVLVIPLARHDHPELERRIGGVGETLLARHGAVGVDVEVPAILAAAHVEIKSVVRFLVDERIGRGIRAEHVLANPAAQQRLRVFLDVDHGAAVGRPRDRRLDVFDHIRQQLAAREVLETQRVLATPDRVFSIGQQPVVRTHFELAHVVEVAAARELLEVEQDLFRCFEGARPTRVHRIFLPGVEAPVIPVASFAIRDGRVVLPDSADDFRVELVLQRSRVGEHRILVGVLRGEVGQHVRVGARVVAQPVVLVAARAVRRIDRARSPCSDRRQHGLRHQAGPPMRTGCDGRVPGAW